MQIDLEHINRLHRLIDWLNNKTKITGNEPEIIAARKNLYKKLLDNPGKTLGEVSNLPSFYQLPETEFRNHLKNINDDLNEQISIFEGFAKRWFENGDQGVPPHYTDRIATILRKAKLFDEEKSFLDAYFKQFWAAQGSSKDQKLGERAKKIGLNIPSIPSSSTWFKGEERSWAKELAIENLSLDISHLKTEDPTKYDIKIKFYCLQCGCKDIEISENNEDQAKCNSCKTIFGSWKSIQRLATRISEKYVTAHNL